MSDTFVVQGNKIVVGYMTVDTAKCGHTTDSPHYCNHDWRVYWGNVDRLVEE